MKDRKLPKAVLKSIIITLFSLFIYGCNSSEVIDKSAPAEKPVQNEIEAALSENTNTDSDEIAVTPPPFTDGIFPCNDCHSYQDPNPERRVLTDMHEEISEMFDHDSQNRWCLDCHDVNNRDSLRLASGKLLDFKESYNLCGQCHGDKLRDWKVGVHGRRTGEWNGKKQYYLCVSCHNPHSPKFPPISPEPAPLRVDEVNK